MLCYMAVERVIQRDFEVNATIMLITAACGVAFNLLLVFSTGHETYTRLIPLTSFVSY